MKQSAIWGKNGMFILVVVSFLWEMGQVFMRWNVVIWGIIGDSIDIHIRPSLGSLCDVEFKISKGDYRMSKYAYACVIRLLIVW